MTSPGTNAPPTRPDVTAVVIGALAAVCGVAAIAGFGDHLMGLGAIGASDGPQASTVAYVGGEALVVVAETGAVLLFTLLSALGLASRRGQAVVTLLAVAAVAKVMWLALSVTSNWKPGWWFILDPKGPHGAARFLFYLSIAQALVMLVAAGLAMKARRE